MVPKDVPFDDALFQFEQGSDQGVLLKSPSRDRRPLVEQCAVKAVSFLEDCKASSYKAYIL